MRRSNDKSKVKAVAVNVTTLQYAVLGATTLVVLVGLVLQLTIVLEHRRTHEEAKLLQQQPGPWRPPIPAVKKRRVVVVRHYQGDEEEEAESDPHSDSHEPLDHHQLDEDDHEHANEDAHLHEGNDGMSFDADDYILPQGFQNALQRALRMQQHCSSLELEQVDETLILQQSNHSVDLPSFGIIHALQSYRPQTLSEQQDWNCQLPPTTECAETQLTVVFLGYRPDRLMKFRRQVHHMIFENEERWHGLIYEVVLVWNGDKELRSTQGGRDIMKWHENDAIPFRIFFPLKEGFSNDLMNRYHPRFDIQTKAILFYDDDGPFYRVEAVTSAFELWKRNSDAQIGAMARRLDVGIRAQQEKDSMMVQQGDERQWISNCRAGGDLVRYNYHHFAQTGANMALPSGSVLHRNYLCFLWHPALHEIRNFVRAHPVHPDDVTVSTIVSHVSGRSPKVYSRRMNKQKEEVESTAGEVVADVEEEEEKADEEVAPEAEAARRRRRLLWDDGNHGVWALKRESSVNSLLGYFGSINSGSDGWCFGTPFHDKVKNICHPDQATMGDLPWMTESHEALACPQVRTMISMAA